MLINLAIILYIFRPRYDNSFGKIRNRVSAISLNNVPDLTFTLPVIVTGWTYFDFKKKSWKPYTSSQNFNKSLI